jgi:IclR family mhp operon transcriptional activator
MANASRSYKDVEAIQRGINVLAALNRVETGFVKSISHEVGLSPATVIRALETLTSCGYVEKMPHRKGYRVTAKVLSLSSGYHGEPMVVAVARPHADELTRRFLWPVSVGMLDVDAMVVRHSTIPSSPLAHVHTTLNKRLSLVARAHGRAYIAFCGAQERNVLLHLVAKSNDPEKNVISSARELRNMIKETRSIGYARRDGRVDPQTTSIAVPIPLDKERIAATLGMTFFPRAVRPRQVLTFHDALLTAAIAISVDLRKNLGW